MKEMKNPLYQLINEHREIIKKEFILFSKNSLSNTNYYMLVPRNQDRSKISTSAGELTPIEYHITIYEENKKEVQNSAFHITINLIDKAKKSYTARIYYTEFGVYLFDKIKDEENNPIEMKSKENLLHFGEQNIAVVLNIILRLQQNYNDQYESMINKLKEQSKSLENIDTKLVEYEQNLLNTINHIQFGTMFNHDHLADLKIYERFLEDIQQKLSHQEVKPHIKKTVLENTEHYDLITQPITKQNETSSTNSKTKINELNKKIAAIVRAKKIRTPAIVLQEYELQSQKLSLLRKTDNKQNKKSKRINETDEIDFMETMNKRLQLLEEINSMVFDSFSDDKKYKKFMGALLQQCSLETDVLIELAVKNNRLLILKSLMQLRKDINFEVKSQDKNQHLLEIAYDKRYLDIFKFLLEHKASPDIVCTNKSSILFCACVAERLEEMEILLEAKADPFALCPKGFAPLGALVMRDDIIPNNDHVNRFLICARQTIDQQQGRTNRLSTPLAYVCQKGWEDTAKLLLSHGANPNIGRFDGVTPLGVCVYKNNFKLFQSIIEHSTVPVKQGLSNALDVAVLFQTLEKNIDMNCFIEEIIRYSKEHQLDLEIPSAADAAIRLEKCQITTPRMIHSISISTFFHNVPRSSYDSDEDENGKITNHSIKQ